MGVDSSWTILHRSSSSGSVDITVCVRSFMPMLFVVHIVACSSVQSTFVRCIPWTRYQSVHLYHHQIVRELVCSNSKPVCPEADTSESVYLSNSFLFFIAAVAAPSIETDGGYGCGASANVTHTPDRASLCGFGRRVHIHPFRQRAFCFGRQAFFTIHRGSIAVRIRWCSIVAGTID